MRIAVLGAGATGTCAALELAARGHAVDLYDETARPVERASRTNEGKIHLGLVYAKDRSLKTAETMIRGALHFRSCLERWIDVDELTLSAPYHYGVHKGTMVDVSALERHYDDCRRLLEDACASTGLRYLGRDSTLRVEKLSRREMERSFSEEYFLAAFRTSELAVDPREIADALRAAVASNPRIRFVARARVLRVAKDDRERLRVSFACEGGEMTETYDQVANTLWHGRLEVDASFGLAPERPWIYRYKLGGWSDVPREETGVPSVTCVLGPFGDIVNLGPRGVYFCWYPAGLVGVSRDRKPPAWDEQLSAGDREAVLRRSWAEWQTRCPGLAAHPYPEGKVEPCGGVIFAWGEADIDRETSRLHSRDEIGIRSSGSYHSVNTGKYTMAPYLGWKTAERLLGLD